MKNQFPLLYHTHHSQRSEDIPFWISLAGEYGGPVLELGCGTGRVLTPLVEAGFTVYGLDNDPDMLDFLHNNLPAKFESNACVFLADMSAFHLAIEFPLILMPCNTFSTLTRKARQDCLACVYKHLSPGGAFVASLPNPLALRDLPDYGAPEWEETLLDPGGGGPFLVSSEWNRRDDRFVVKWHYDLLLPDGRVQRLTAVASHDLALREDYLVELERAGLQEVASYGSFTRTRYRASSTDMILIARKETPAE